MLTGLMRPFCLLLALFALAGCSQQQILNTLTTDAGYQITANIPFSPEHPLLALDVYTPSHIQNAPVVVFFYGGRWATGSKDQYKFVGQALTAQGFVTVIADYRKYPQVRFPEFVKDAARAVQWTHDNIGQYGGDPAKLFVMGHDAGAQIAALLALDANYLKAVGGNRSWLRGMIGLAGPYDFMPITAPDLRDLFGPPDQFTQSQPIMFADGHNPPLLLMTGLDDESVLPSNTENLYKAVIKAGGPAEIVTYPKMSHSMILATIAAPLRRNSDVMVYITKFIWKHLSPVAASSSSPAADDDGPRPENIQLPPLETTTVTDSPTPVPAVAPAAAPAPDADSQPHLKMTPSLTPQPVPIPAQN